MPPFTQKQNKTHEDSFIGLDAANKRLKNLDSKDLRRLLVSESINFLTETKRARCNLSKKINTWTGEIDDIKAKIDHVLYHVENVNSKATTNRSSIQHLGGEVYNLLTRINNQEKLFKSLLGPSNGEYDGKERLGAPHWRKHKYISGGKIRKHSSKTNLLSTKTNSVLKSVYSSNKENTIKKRTISRTNSIRMTSVLTNDADDDQIITTEELCQVDTISTTKSIGEGGHATTASVSRTNSITKRRSITRSNSNSKTILISYNPQITNEDSDIFVKPEIHKSITRSNSNSKTNLISYNPQITNEDSDIFVKPEIHKNILRTHRPNELLDTSTETTDVCQNMKHIKKKKAKIVKLPLIKNATGNISDASMKHYISSTENELSFCEEDQDDKLILYKRFPQHTKPMKLNYNYSRNAVNNVSHQRGPPPSYADFLECKILKKVRRYINVNSRQKAAIRHKINIALYERKFIGGKQPWKY